MTEKIITRDNCLVYKEYDVIKGDLTIKFELLFSEPKKHPTESHYICYYTIINKENNRYETMKICGSHGIQALLLAIHSSFDLLDIFAKELIANTAHEK